MLQFWSNHLSEHVLETESKTLIMLNKEVPETWFLDYNCPRIDDNEMSPTTQYPHYSMTSFSCVKYDSFMIERTFIPGLSVIEEYKRRGWIYELHEPNHVFIVSPRVGLIMFVHSTPPTAIFLLNIGIIITYQLTEAY